MSLVLSIQDFAETFSLHIIIHGIVAQGLAIDASNIQIITFVKFLRSSRCQQCISASLVVSSEYEAAILYLRRSVQVCDCDA